MDIGPKAFVPMASPPPLAAGTLHLWSIDLALGESQVEALTLQLTDEERQRAQRFRFPRHRRRFLVRRARLRQLVAAYQGISNEAMAFEYTARGKPYLPSHLDRHSEGPLAFNLSDSKDLAVMAVSRAGTSQSPGLGVDVEILREIPDALGISKSFFAQSEREVLASVNEARRAETFFNCWTRKEAYIKATGEGLSAPLDQFSVTLHPDDGCRFEEIHGDPESAKNWTLLAFQPIAGSVGAIACERLDLRVGGCFRFVES